MVGATNRPDELDEAARRRFVKRLYIPLPDAEARSALVTLLLRKNSHALTEAEIQAVVGRTEGFSGADVKSLCTEAAMGPVRAVRCRHMVESSVGGWYSGCFYVVLESHIDANPCRSATWRAKGPPASPSFRPPTCRLSPTATSSTPWPPCGPPLGTRTWAS